MGLLTEQILKKETTEVVSEVIKVFVFSIRNFLQTLEPYLNERKHFSRGNGFSSRRDRFSLACRRRAALNLK